MKIVVGVSGASGALYAARTLAFLAGPGREAGIEADVVFSKTARVVWQDELPSVDPSSFGLKIWPAGDMTAPFASGSSMYDAMIIIPCSAGCMARVAQGVSSNLIERAADVMLKERRPLVLVLRETPLSLIHVKNIETLVLAGATVMPAAPSFYSRPQTMEALADTVVCRALDRVGVANNLMRRWRGLEGRDVGSV